MSRLAASRAQYSNVVGTPAETLASASSAPGVPTSFDIALSMALRNHPTIIEARASARGGLFGRRCRGWRLTATESGQWAMGPRVAEFETALAVVKRDGMHAPRAAIPVDLFG